MDAIFDPPIFRYTVRMPESRRGALRRAAERVGMRDDQLMQALVDCIDLSRCDGQVSIAKAAFDKLFPGVEDTRELADRARSVGMTVRELKVFRALAMAAGIVRIVRPDPMDIVSRSGVPPHYLDAVYDKLLEKGFIALAPSQGRGRRVFAIARMPEI